MMAQSKEKSQLDDLLRRMLSTPPQPKTSQPTQKQTKPKAKKTGK